MPRQEAEALIGEPVYPIWSISAKWEQDGKQIEQAVNAKYLPFETELWAAMQQVEREAEVSYNIRLALVLFVMVVAYIGLLLLLIS